MEIMIEPDMFLGLFIVYMYVICLGNVGDQVSILRVRVWVMCILYETDERPCSQSPCTCGCQSILYASQCSSLASDVVLRLYT